MLTFCDSPLNTHTCGAVRRNVRGLPELNERRSVVECTQDSHSVLLLANEGQEVGHMAGEYA